MRGEPGRPTDVTRTKATRPMHVTDQDWLAQRFEANRTHLRAVAYRMLGSLAEADDAVQEAWIRLSRTDTSDVDNLSGWLTTVVGRVCLNMLRSRRTRREAPLDTHVPDPIVSPEDGMDPEHEALLGDSLGLALLAVLDALTPAERVAFALHDALAMSFRRFAETATRALVNGVPGGVAWDPDGRPFAVISLTVAGGRIVSIDVLADPDRLRQTDLAGSDR